MAHNLISDREPLKPHQEYGIRQVQKWHKCPMIMPRGAGKTRTAIEAAESFSPRLPILVIVPRTGLAQWRAQIKKWTNYEDVQIQVLTGGNASDRHVTWKRIAKKGKCKYHYILTTYGSVINDIALLTQINWPVVITDESHRIRNRKTKGFKAIKAMRFEVGIYISGSIFRSQVLDIWTLMHLSDKQRFGSYWKFANYFVYVIEGQWGKEFGGPRHTHEFGRLLRERCIYVRQDELKGVLPSLNRQRLYVDLYEDQLELYNRIWEDLILEVGENKDLIISPNEMVRTIRARQCLACPALLSESYGVGAGFATIVEHASGDPHYIVFTAFAAALPHYEKYLRDKGYKDVYVIRGGMDMDEQERVTKEFERTRGILLCSVTVAESWEVLSCNTSYFIGFDWSPDINEQAEDRIRRVSSTHVFVNAYYICSEGKYDEQMLDVLGQKYGNVHRALKMTEDDT